MITIKTELPLSMESLRQVITQPDVAVEVIYNESKLKGRGALIYMSNTNLPNVSFDMTNVAIEDKFALVDDYITNKSVLCVEQLVNTVINVLLTIKHVELLPEEQQILDEMSVFTRADVTEYLTDAARIEHLNKLVELLDSLPLYAITCSTTFREIYGRGKDVFEAVNDVNHTGFTFVNLFEHPLFMEYFTRPPTTQLKYFTQQFDEYMYNGKSLFPYLVESPIFAILECFITGAITVEQVVQAWGELNVLEGVAA